MLTNASKYAIRSVLFLAKNSDINNKYGIKTIAKDLDVPVHFIAKLLQPLVKSKIISSTKGPNGGYYFTKNNGERNVCDIIYIIEGKPLLNECFMGLPECGDENPCPIHHIVAPFKEQILEKFQNMTLAEYAQEIKENGSYLSLVNIIPTTED
jgi:Rrf2 family protein